MVKQAHDASECLPILTTSPAILQDARSASTIFIRAARAAGMNPPTSPMPSAKSSVLTAIAGVSRKLKASSENDCQFMVEIVKACISEAAASPATPPRSDSSRLSTMKATITLDLRNPKARSVPISAVRLATAAYIVMAPPITAPTEKNRR